MTVAQVVYDALTNDPIIQSLLANSSTDPTKKAIYEEWANREANYPYLCYTLSNAESDHFAKAETLLNLDIFTWSDTITADKIAKQCEFIFARQELTDPEDGAVIRCYYNRDGFVTEPTDQVIHHNSEFSLYYWKKDFMAHLLQE